MARPSIVVTLALICVSLSISEAFLAFTAGSHRSSFAKAISSSRLWRVLRSAYAEEPEVMSEAFPATSSFRRRRSVVGDDPSSAAATGDGGNSLVTGMTPGPGNTDASFEDGILTIIRKETMKVKLFGSGFNFDVRLKFDSREQEAGTDCEHQIEGVEFEFDDVDPQGRWGVMTMNLNEPRFTPVFICIREGNTTRYIHQGRDKSVLIQTKTRTSLPFGAQVFLLCLLLLMSGMFSGLNLGLMALDKTELQIVMNCGREKEKNYARKIQPVRNKGNYLLCTLLLSNVLVNSTLTILMDELTGGGGLVAIVGSTMGIVVFGEIIPQAVCSRHGLAVGAYTLWITKFFMLITFPIAFPISLVLDKLLGEEIGSVYDRNRLRELIQVTHGYHDLKKEEMNIIAGALALSEKKVREIMTPLEDVFMISYDALLDFHTMSDIMKKGYTRIPVYDGERTNIVGLLNIKDLAFVDPDDCIPLKTLCKFYQHHLHSVFEDTKLDLMLEEFKKGQCHMALVQYVNNEGEGDPFYEIIGVVTLEDVIEEIIQSEILDETDVILDNKRKIHRELPHNPDFTVFYNQEDQKAPKITPQLSLAIFQFLSVNVEPFQEQNLSTNILRRLIKKYDVIEDIRHKDTKPTLIYERNKPADFFCLVLQGRVEVHVGKEDMIFETGPFSYFGVQALTSLLTSHSFLSSSRSSLNAAVIPSTAHPQGDASLTITANQEPSSLPAVLGAVGNSSAGGMGTFQRSGSGKPPIYVPDFSVKTTADTQILKIRRTHYLAARRAVMLEKQPKTSGSAGTPFGDISVEDAFNKEWNRTMNHINNKLDQRGVRSASYREDRMGRDRRSTCSSTAKEPETSSETLPSPQNSDDLLGDGLDKRPAPLKLNGTYDIDRVPAPPSEATTISQSLGGATQPVDFCFSPSSLPPSISALASPLSPVNDDDCPPSLASNNVSDHLPSPPPPSYASLTAAAAASRNPPSRKPPSRPRLDDGDCGDSGGADAQSRPAAKLVGSSAVVFDAAPPVPEVDLTDVAVVDRGTDHSSTSPAEKTAFLSHES